MNSAQIESKIIASRLPPNADSLNAPRQVLDCGVRCRLTVVVWSTRVRYCIICVDDEALLDRPMRGGRYVKWRLALASGDVGEPCTRYSSIVPEDARQPASVQNTAGLRSTKELVHTLPFMSRSDPPKPTLPQQGRYSDLHLAEHTSRRPSCH